MLQSAKLPENYGLNLEWGTWNHFDFSLDYLIVSLFSRKCNMLIVRKLTKLDTLHLFTEEAYTYDSTFIHFKAMFLNSLNDLLNVTFQYYGRYW
jgi:hypothetical protein